MNVLPQNNFVDRDAPPIVSLLDNLNTVAGGNDAIDESFLRSLDELRALRDGYGQGALWRQAAGTLLAAVTMIRTEFGHDVVDSILDAAHADNERLRQRAAVFSR